MTRNRNRAPYRSVALLGAAALIPLCIACATREPPAELVDARQEVQQATQDASVASNAGRELQEARNALAEAEQVWDGSGDAREEETEHLATLALTRVEVAREAARRRRAEQEMRELGERRSAILLEARSLEADIAQTRATLLESRARAAEERAEDLQERTEELASQLEEFETTRRDEGLELTLQDLPFETGEATLKPGGTLQLDAIADVLAGHPDRQILIEGHTDDVGDEAFNQQLSERRADAVKDFLVSRNVEAARIETRGFGESHPIASNDDAAGRQMNRRVSILILDPPPAISAGPRSGETPGTGTR